MSLRGTKQSIGIMCCPYCSGRIYATLSVVAEFISARESL